MSANSKKILIIGSANYDRSKEGIRIECIPWQKLSGLQNVSDYDLLLVNLLGLRTEADRKEVDWARFQALFDFAATSDVLSHDGEVVILGDPRFSIPHWKENGKQRPFLYWIGIKFNWDAEPGDTIQYARYGIDDFAEFRRHFHRWSYSLQRAEPDETALGEKWDVHRTCTNSTITASRPNSILPWYARTDTSNHLSLGFGIGWLMATTATKFAATGLSFFFRTSDWMRMKVSNWCCVIFVMQPLICQNRLGFRRFPLQGKK